LQQTKDRSKLFVETDDGVLVSDKLSKYLKVDVGDSNVLMGQGTKDRVLQDFSRQGHCKSSFLQFLDNKRCI
jgi:hypothetical protein